ncbi:MAG: cereblon family protein [Gammaproteobacteria bacterium]|nr:cereblon family protein [Gammaproteobacteria bacterium]
MHVKTLPEQNLPSGFYSPLSGYCLKKDSNPGEKYAPSVNQRIEDKIDKGILCLQCRRRITGDECRVEVNHGHQHSFTNPAQVRFTIGCFSSAPGCAGVNGFTSEFTWFPGYQWQVVLCGGCAEHLGWKFKALDHRFYGLILNRLLNSDE